MEWFVNIFKRLEIWIFVFPTWCLSLCIATKEPHSFPASRWSHLHPVMPVQITPVETQMCLVHFLVNFFIIFFFTCTEIISHCVINCADPGLLKYVGPDCKPLAYLVPLKVSGIEKLCCTPVGSGSSMQPTDLCVNQLAQIIDFFIQSHSSTLLLCHSEFVVMNDMSTYILIVSLPEPTALVQ